MSSMNLVILTHCLALIEIYFLFNSLLKLKMILPFLSVSLSFLEINTITINCEFFYNSKRVQIFN